MPLCPPVSVDLEAVLERWLQDLRLTHNRSASTCKSYGDAARRWLAYCQEQAIDPLQADRDVLAVYTGPYLHQRGLRAGGRKVVICGLRSFYRYLHQRGACALNPADIISPRLGRRLPVAMSLDAAQSLMYAPDLGTLRGLRDAAMIAVLMGCGIRLAGLVGMDVEDLIVERDGADEHLTIRVTEKGDRQRLVPAPPEAWIMIRAYLGHPDLQAIDRSTPAGRTVLWVSLSRRGVAEHEWCGERRRITGGAVRHRFKVYGERLGLDPAMLHPHALRHLYGTELAEAEVDLLVRQELMGHVDANNTKIYTALAMRRLRGAATKGPLSKIDSPASQLLRRLG